jgi:uncharacterized metal-binding protein YceD (DUF177 family)
MSGGDTSPIAFRVHVRRLPKKGMPVRIEADARQRSALAAAHGLVSVGSFVAELLVKDWKAHGVRVEGRVDADIEQACIVSLEPVSAVIAEEIDAVFVPEDSRLARADRSAEGEIHLSPDGPDAPETFAGDEIDVGALAEEFFGLAIDPYPRKPGAVASGPSSPPEREGPFAALAALRGKGGIRGA